MTHTVPRSRPVQPAPRLRCEVCGCGEWATFMRPGDGCRTADDQLRECGGKLREAK